MSIESFRETKNIENIVSNEELTTMEKLKQIVGDNYFTNSNRAKGIYQLLQNNATEIGGNHYMASVFANAIKMNCLADFQRIVNNNPTKVELPDAVKDVIDAPMKTGDDFDR